MVDIRDQLLETIQQSAFWTNVGFSGLEHLVSLIFYTNTAVTVSSDKLKSEDTYKHAIFYVTPRAVPSMLINNVSSFLFSLYFQATEQ